MVPGPSPKRFTMAHALLLNSQNLQSVIVGMTTIITGKSASRVTCRLERSKAFYYHFLFILSWRYICAGKELP
jgi:hypothetical protein